MGGRLRGIGRSEFNAISNGAPARKFYTKAFSLVRSSGKRRVVGADYFGNSAYQPKQIYAAILSNDATVP